MLSCAGCFNTISFKANSMKYLNNVYTSDSIINCYVDFTQIYTTYELVHAIHENSTKEIAKQLNNKQLAELGIEEEFKEKSQFVCIKCKNCKNIVGVSNSQNNKCILFNSI